MIAEALKSQSDLEPDIRKAEPKLSSYLAEKVAYYVHHFVVPLDPEDEGYDKINVKEAPDE